MSSWKQQQHLQETAAQHVCGDGLQVHKYFFFHVKPEDTEHMVQVFKNECGAPEWIQEFTLKDVNAAFVMTVVNAIRISMAVATGAIDRPQGGYSKGLMDPAYRPTHQ